MNLLDKWNDHIIKGNQLSRELENIEELLEKAKEADICFSSGSNGAIFIRVLSPEKMQELKGSAIDAIARTKDDKVKELERLMPEFRKPATINPEFEAAVQGMVQSKDKPVVVVPAMDEAELPPVNKTPEKLPGKKILGKGSELDNAVFSVEDKPAARTLTDDNLEDVRRMYQREGKSMKEIAEHYGVTKSVVNNFVYNKKLARSKVKDDGFLDSKVQARSGKECL